jgi:pimeloyl-ACP methyl ester carboxylesterase
MEKDKMMTTRNVVATLFFASILLLLLPSLLFANSVDATHAITPIVSTRGDFGRFSGNLMFGETSTSYEQPSSIPSCSTDREIVIYVHGWNADEEYAIDQFNVLKQSLINNGYTQPVFGYSWDSDTLGFFAWDVGKDIAQKNGLKLAKFILDFKAICEQAKIRLIGHSLGSWVIINALDSLHNNAIFDLWNDNNYRVTSVHLMAAAVNPAEVSITRGFGIPIRDEVEQFHNKYSQEDDVLETLYRDTEGHIALGEHGSQNMASGLVNYHEEEVSQEISRDIDGDGTVDKPNTGDDHMGYAGVFNTNTGELSSDGVMNLIVSEWSNK